MVKYFFLVVALLMILPIYGTVNGERATLLIKADSVHSESDIYVSVYVINDMNKEVEIFKPSSHVGEVGMPYPWSLRIRDINSGKEYSSPMAVLAYPSRNSIIKIMNMICQKYRLYT